jgi:tRNA pseudouridine38-40 synthase
MSRRLKMIVAYDGKGFAGWQSQSHRNTIQDHLERALARIAGKPVRVHGAGRTDGGVHAIGQCAHVDIPDDRLSAASWTKALNALLPAAIRVLRCRYVARNFHARLSAKSKLYRYRIWSDSILPPFEHGRAWHVTTPLDLKVLRKAANAFIGTHDFAAFAASRGKSGRRGDTDSSGGEPEINTVRTIYSARVRRDGRSITIEFEGDGFLYKMVRLIIGSLVRCATNKMRIEDVIQPLNSGRVGQARFAAPAEGLFLVRVRY